MDSALQHIFDEWYEKKGKGFQRITNLGFFSQPFRIYPQGMNPLVMKIYKPVRSKELALQIVSHHASYVSCLQHAGVQIPDTFLHLVERHSRNFLVVVQSPFADDELVRYRMMTGERESCIALLKALLAQTIDFLQSGVQVGFHPTLRNFAWREGLWFFDTFPPMDMSQPNLNRIILHFAPVSLPLSRIPTSWVNHVSNEYYQPSLMLKGLVGSSCRLRPEWSEDFLSQSRLQITASGLPDHVIEQTLDMLHQPPRLSGLWTGIRSLLGKEGKPNVPR